MRSTYCSEPHSLQTALAFAHHVHRAMLRLKPEAIVDDLKLLPLQDSLGK